MTSFSSFCRDLFLISHLPVGGSGSARGEWWEQRVAQLVTTRSLPVESVPGGYCIFGHAASSGLAHQVDAALACSDALVIGEWKARRRPILKNEVLRFKAVTDDYFLALENEGTEDEHFHLQVRRGHTIGLED